VFLYVEKSWLLIVGGKPFLKEFFKVGLQACLAAHQWVLVFVDLSTLAAKRRQGCHAPTDLCELTCLLSLVFNFLFVLNVLQSRSFFYRRKVSLKPV